MVQDTLTGAFRISNPKIRIPEFIVMNIMAKLRRPLASFDKNRWCKPRFGRFGSGLDG